jgi:hypothetical protein
MSEENKKQKFNFCKRLKNFLDNHVYEARYMMKYKIETELSNREIKIWKQKSKSSKPFKLNFRKRLKEFFLNTLDWFIPLEKKENFNVDGKWESLVYSVFYWFLCFKSHIRFPLPPKGFVVEIHGDLREQFTQYMFANELYKFYKGKYPVALDIGWFFKKEDKDEEDKKENKTPRNLELLNFKVRELFPFEFVILDGKIKRKYHSRAIRSHDLYEDNIFECIELRSFLCIDDKGGYIPSHDQNKVKNALELSVPLNKSNRDKLEQIKNCNSVSMCLEELPKLDFDPKSSHYYNETIREIISKTGWKELTIFIFSKESEWVEKYMDFKVEGVDLTIDYVDINTPKESSFDLELMRNCQ